jgi:hypothetical protein
LIAFNFSGFLNSNLYIKTEQLPLENVIFVQ